MSDEMPICPWCGEDVDDTPLEIPFCGNETKVDCMECGRPVKIVRQIDVTYETTKIEQP